MYCERYGIERQLLRADDSHSWLGILDRRCQIVRFMYPKLADELNREYILAEDHDICAEVQIALNTQLSYGGHTPYECLYGCLPTPLFSDESEYVSQLSQEGSAFYEHTQVRAPAISVFQQALLQHGLARSLHSRPRSDIQRSYRIGE